MMIGSRRRRGRNAMEMHPSAAPDLMMWPPVAALNRGQLRIVTVVVMVMVVGLITQLPAASGAVVTVYVNERNDSVAGNCSAAGSVDAAGAQTCNLRAAAQYCETVVNTTTAVEVPYCEARLANGTHILTQGQIRVSSSRFHIVGQPKTGDTIVNGRHNDLTRFLRIKRTGDTTQGQKLHAAFVMENVTIEEFSDKNGGAVHLQSVRDVIFRRVHWIRNAATNHAGAVNVDTNTSQIVFEDCEFRLNVATQSGGSVNLHIQNDNVTFDRCSWHESVADNGGGVMVNWNNRGVRFLDCEWNFCIAAEGSGGGLAVGSHNNDVHCDSCTFFANLAAVGGGMNVDSDNRGLVFSSTMWRNNTAGQGGGAAFGDGNANAHFDQCEFLNNSARDGQRGGGGLSLSESNKGFTYTAVRWAKNVAAYYGGALLMYSTNAEHAFTDSVFEDNDAASGGAVVLDLLNSNVSFTNVSWKRNGLAGAYQGGSVSLFNQQRNISFVECEWLHNGADLGAGLYVGQNSKFINVLNSVGRWNRAVSGGVIYVHDSNVHVRIIDSVFEQNGALALGGALFLYEANDFLLVERCLFSSNAAVVEGGAMESALLCSNCAIVDTVVENCTAAVGGSFNLGVFDQWLFLRVTISGSSARSGGAIVAANALFLAFVGCDFSDNIADSRSGGGMQVFGLGTVALANTTMNRNRAATDGGALAVLPGPELYLYNVSMQRNVAEKRGGAIYTSTSDSTVGDLAFILRSLNLTFNVLKHLAPNIEAQQSEASVRLDGNSAIESGGGWYAEDGTIVAENMSIDNCSAQDDGGGMLLSSTATSLSRVVLQGNRAGASGAGIACTGAGSLLLAGFELSDGVASLGAGISIETGHDVAMSQGRILRNLALGSGGGLFTGASTVNISDTRFADNEAIENGGGGLYWRWDIAGSEPAFTRNVSFSGNSAPYGHDFATPIYRIDTVSSTKANSGADLPAVNVTTKDYYDQVVHSYPGCLAEVRANAGVNCSSDTLSLTGSTSASFIDGTATFFGTIVTCEPGSHVILNYTVTDETLGGQVFVSTVDVVLNACNRLGEYNDNSGQCNLCEDGKYIWPGMDTCKNCPSPAQCTDGWKMKLAKGYWRSHNFSANVLECPAPSSCLGGMYQAAPGQCSEGSKGALCQVCEPGYYQPNALAQCEACSSSRRFTPLAIVTSFFLLVGAAFAWLKYWPPAWFVEFRRKHSMSSLRTFFKVLFSYLQIVSQYHLLFPTDFPTAYVSTTSALDVTNLGFTSLFAPACLNSNWHFYDGLLLHTIGIVVVVVAGFVSCAIIVAVAGSSVEERKRYRSWALKALLIFCYVIQPGTTTLLFRAFPCDSSLTDSDFNDVPRLKADYSINCRATIYKSYVAFSSVAILAIPFGIMALNAFVLWRYRTQICPDVGDIIANQGRGKFGSLNPTTKVTLLVEEVDETLQLLQSRHPDNNPPARLRLYATTQRQELQHACRRENSHLDKAAFLFEHYKPNLWYFELVESVRRLFMSSFLVFFWPGNGAMQIVAAMVICMGFIVLYSWLRPYIRDLSNQLAISLLWCTLLLLLVTLLVNQEVLDNSPAVGALMILLMVLGPGLAFVRVLLRMPVRMVRQLQAKAAADGGMSGKTGSGRFSDVAINLVRTIAMRIGPQSSVPQHRDMRPGPDNNRHTEHGFGATGDPERGDAEADDVSLAVAMATTAASPDAAPRPSYLEMRSRPSRATSAGSAETSNRPLRDPSDESSSFSSSSRAAQNSDSGGGSGGVDVPNPAMSRGGWNSK